MKGAFSASNIVDFANGILRSAAHGPPQHIHKWKCTCSRIWTFFSPPLLQRNLSTCERDHVKQHHLFRHQSQVTHDHPFISRPSCFPRVFLQVLNMERAATEARRAPRRSSRGRSSGARCLRGTARTRPLSKKRSWSRRFVALWSVAGESVRSYR